MLKVNKENIIVEEISRNKEFVESILDICVENKIENKWFKITRDMSDIIKTNEERKRGVKNTPETLEIMKSQIDVNEIE